MDKRVGEDDCDTQNPGVRLGNNYNTQGKKEKHLTYTFDAIYVLIMEENTGIFMINNVKESLIFP